MIRDEVSSYTGAAVVPEKGPSPYAVAFLEKFLDEVCYPRVVSQTDGEPAILALGRALVRATSRESKDIMTQISLRQSPPGSHSSNGMAGDGEEH